MTEEGYERTGLKGRVLYAVADPETENIVLQRVEGDHRRLGYWVDGELVECGSDVQFTVPDYTWFSGDSVVVASEGGRVLKLTPDGCSTAFDAPSGLPTELLDLRMDVVPTDDWRVVEIHRPNRQPLTVQLVEER